MQHRAPLDKARHGNADRRVLLQIHFAPRAPIAVRIVHIAAARVQIEAAPAAHFGASPLGKDLGVENIALVAAIGIWPGAEQPDFAQIAGSHIETTAGSFGKPNYLIGADFEQIGKAVIQPDCINVPTIAGAGEQASAAVKAERINQICLRGPQPFRRAFWSDSVDFRASGA